MTRPRLAKSAHARPETAYSTAMTAPLLDHIGIATPDLDQGSAPYLALGLTPAGPDEHVPSQGVNVRVFQVGQSMVELLAPARPDSAIARYLEKNRPGLHHTAYRVPDLDAEVTRLRAQGAAFLSDAPGPGLHGTRVIFLHPKWGQGTLIELVEHPAGGGH